jgi:hypothetical protein
LLVGIGDVVGRLRFTTGGHYTGCAPDCLAAAGSDAWVILGVDDMDWQLGALCSGGESAELSLLRVIRVSIAPNYIQMMGNDLCLSLAGSAKLIHAQRVVGATSRLLTVS